MKLHVLFKILFILVIYCFGITNARAASQGATCAEIKKVDFNNLSFDVLDKTFNFHNGEAVNFSDNSAKKVEWRANIERDNTIDATTNIPGRFLLIHVSHEGGKGWKYYFVGFSCLNGSLKKVFERDGVSLKVEKVETKAVEVSLIPVTSSTGRKYFSYVWNAKKSKYVLENVNTHK